MTHLTRPVRRLAPSVYSRPLVVTLYPNQTIGLRPARTRREYLVTLSRVFRLALEVSMEADRRAKLDAKNARRLSRGLGLMPVKVRRSLV